MNKVITIFQPSASYTTVIVVATRINQSIDEGQLNPRRWKKTLPNRIEIFKNRFLESTEIMESRQKDKSRGGGISEETLIKFFLTPRLLRTSGLGARVEIFSGLYAGVEIFRAQMRAL